MRVNESPALLGQAIDVRSGDIVHWLRLEGSLFEELYDVAVLPGIRRPMAIGVKTDEIRRLITIGSLSEEGKGG